MEKTKTEPKYLECESWSTFALLMFSAGCFGTFTYIVRGGVFSNAQTGNCVLMSIALAQSDWSGALYYLIPMGAYLAGVILSEILPNRVKKTNLLRWDTLFVGFEMLVVLCLGFLPRTAPVQITHIAISFITAMQYNTFRQAQSIPMATTFCTNHFRQLGVSIVQMFKKGYEKEGTRHFKAHLGMLLVFVVGGMVSAYLCKIIEGKAIWFSLFPLGIVFIKLMWADLTKEKNLLSRKPSGH